jgi:hypothetical protein
MQDMYIETDGVEILGVTLMERQCVALISHLICPHRGSIFSDYAGRGFAPLACLAISGGGRTSLTHHHLYLLAGTATSGWEGGGRGLGLLQRYINNILRDESASLARMGYI